MVIFLVPVMLLVPQSSPGKLVSGTRNLLALLFSPPFLFFPLCFLLFLPPRAFRGSARQAFLVKFSLILLLKFRQLTHPYNSYLIFITLVMLPCRCCGLIP